MTEGISGNPQAREDGRVFGSPQAREDGRVFGSPQARDNGRTFGNLEERVRGRMVLPRTVFHDNGRAAKRGFCFCVFGTTEI